MEEIILKDSMGVNELTELNNESPKIITLKQAQLEKSKQDIKAEAEDSVRENWKVNLFTKLGNQFFNEDDVDGNTDINREALTDGACGIYNAKLVFNKFRKDLLAKMIDSNFGMMTLADFLSEYHKDDKVKKMIFLGVEDAMYSNKKYSKEDYDNWLFLLKDSIGERKLEEGKFVELNESFKKLPDHIREAKKIINELNPPERTLNVKRSRPLSHLYDPSLLNELKKDLTPIKEEIIEYVENVTNETKWL